MDMINNISFNFGLDDMLYTLIHLIFAQVGKNNRPKTKNYITDVRGARKLNARKLDARKLNVREN